MPEPNRAKEFDVRRRSPFDAGHAKAAGLVQILETKQSSPSWMPSRFNARTTDAEGNTILWNSLSGAITVFGPRQSQSINELLTREGYRGPLSPLAEYLAQRGFLTPSGRNELEHFRLIFGQQHYRTDRLELILLASEDCNLRCAYCYEDFQRGTMMPEVRRNIKELVRKKVGSIQHLTVSWFGGEPLYGYEAIEDLAPFFKKISAESGWTFGASMTTNAYLLTPSVARQLLGWDVRQFQITLDGPQEQHDRNRPARDGSGTFSIIMSNLLSLRDIKEPFTVRLRINYDKGNIGFMRELLDLLEGSFSGDSRYRVSFHPVGQWGGANDANLDICGVEEARDLRSELNAEAFSRGLGSSSLAENPYPGGSVCYAARPFNLIIGAAGQVMKCTIVLDKDPSNVVGVLEEGGNLRMNSERFARWVAPAFETDTSCQSCHLLPACQGISCPLVRFESGRSPCDATPKHTLHNDLVAAHKFQVERQRAATVAVSGKS
jgi:uncharacterized protein